MNAIRLYSKRRPRHRSDWFYCTHWEKPASLARLARTTFRLSPYISARGKETCSAIGQWGTRDTTQFLFPLFQNDAHKGVCGLVRAEKGGMALSRLSTSSNQDRQAPTNTYCISPFQIYFRVLYSTLLIADQLSLVGRLVQWKDLNTIFVCSMHSLRLLPSQYSQKPEEIFLRSSFSPGHSFAYIPFICRLNQTRLWLFLGLIAHHLPLLLIPFETVFFASWYS